MCEMDSWTIDYVVNDCYFIEQYYRWFVALVHRFSVRLHGSSPTPLNSTNIFSSLFWTIYILACLAHSFVTGTIYQLKGFH